MALGKVIPGLLADIDKKHSVLSKNPDYHLLFRKLGFSELTNVGAMHSFLLEHPDIAENIIVDKYKNSVRMAKKGSEKLIDAWSYLRPIKNLEKVIDHDIIKDVGFRVDDRNSTYRVNTALLNLSKFSPPEPERIRYCLQNLFDDLKESYYHPIESSAFSHIVIAGTQPFQDGNKRVARLIHNKILFDNNYPLVTVKSAERKHYLDLLEYALEGVSIFNESTISNHDNIRPFFTFMATKVNLALDEIAENMIRKKYGDI